MFISKELEEQIKAIYQGLENGMVKVQDSDAKTAKEEKQEKVIKKGISLDAFYEQLEKVGKGIYLDLENLGNIKTDSLTVAGFQKLQEKRKQVKKFEFQYKEQDLEQFANLRTAAINQATEKLKEGVYTSKSEYLYEVRTLASKIKGLPESCWNIVRSCKRNLF